MWRHGFFGRLWRHGLFGRSTGFGDEPAPFGIGREMDAGSDGSLGLLIRFVPGSDLGLVNRIAPGGDGGVRLPVGVFQAGQLEQGGLVGSEDVEERRGGRPGRAG